MNGLYGNSISLMNKALDCLWKRQEVISNNLANVDTPGYKAQYVTFEDALKKSIEKSAVKGRQNIREAILNSPCEVLETQGRTERLDGNTVDATDEFVEMTRATYQYQYLLNAVNQDLSRLRTVIKGN